MTNHERFMQRCLDLASLGIRSVYPNPMVGAVIVNNGQIIGEGFHKQFAHEHAEVNAIQSVKDKTLLKNSTLYVSLEPCSHFGNTPPCVNVILENKIPNVVVSSKDPNPIVLGKGLDILKNNNVNVITDVLTSKSKELNKRFYTFHTKKRPFITLKWAESKDSFIDINRNNSEKGVFWISSPETQSLVHFWRSQEHSILIGRKTYDIDKPQLSVRFVDGKNPIRIVIDKNLKCNYNNYNQFETIIFNNVLSKKDNNIEFVNINDFSLNNILKYLYKIGILSIFVEGGNFTLSKFIDENLWDEAKVIISKKNINFGIKAPNINKKPTNYFNFGNDKVLIYNNY